MTRALASVKRGLASVLHLFRTRWWPWLVIVGFALFYLAGSQYRQSRENCRKIDKLDSALIGQVKGARPAMAYPVTIVHADGLREKATVLVAASKGGPNPTSMALASAACDPHNIVGS